MSNQIHKDSENVDEITIVFHAEASDPFLKDPCVEFGIAYEEQNLNKRSMSCYFPGEIER